MKYWAIMIGENWFHNFDNGLVLTTCGRYGWGPQNLYHNIPELNADFAILLENGHKDLKVIEFVGTALTTCPSI